MKKRKNNLAYNALPASIGLVKEVRDELRADIRAVELGLSSKIEQVLVSVHRSQVLMEEQRGENRVVLDGINSLFERQSRFENDVDGLQNAVRILGSAAKR